MEPLKWPIAPDGYIPNSVIRSWGMKKEVLSQTVSWEDMIFHSHHLEDTTRSEEDFKPNIFWYDDEDEEADEETGCVNRRRKVFVDEKNKEEDKTSKSKKDIEKKTEDEEHPPRKFGGQRERAEEKIDMVATDLLKSSCNIQTKTRTLHCEEIKLEQKDVSSTTSSAIFANMHDGPVLFATSKTLGAINNMNSSRNVSSSTLGQKTRAEDLTVLREDAKLCDTSAPPLFSVSTRQRTSAALPKGPRITNDTMSIQPQDWTSYSTPSVTDLPPPEFAPGGRFPDRDEMFLLFKEKNFTGQVVPPVDPKTLKLFRKYKDTMKYSSHHLNATGKLHLNTGRNRSPALKANLSSFPIQHHKIIHPELPERCLNSGSLCHSVQPKHLLVCQRVVKKIQIKDTVKAASTLFRHVIPMSARNSFATLDLSGTTQYGRLQFDWVRGHEGDKLLEISGTKTESTTHCFHYHHFVPP